MKRIRLGSLARIVAILGVGIIIMSGSARAQQWQSTFGSPRNEDGRGGVKPLNGGGGYISVGSSNMNGNYDVYVVEENLTGGVIWAFNYDIANGDDFGYDIQELAGGGFIITGKSYVDQFNGFDLLLLKINAAGGVVWAETFGGPGVESGADVLEAANGDYVAVGQSTSTPTEDGVFVRVTAAGGIVNVLTYDGTIMANEELHGVWEAANGELLACGSYNNGTQAWIMRTSAIGIPIWSNQVGGIGNDRFNSVIELTVGPQAGNIVATGATATLNAFYVAKFTGAGAMIAPDVGGGNFNATQEMFQIREIKNGANAGDLLLTGYMTPGPFGGDDGYAVEMTPVWNCPGGRVWSRVYGGIGNDRLSSGDDDFNNCTPGYILCGYTTSLPLLLPPDPQGMYVIKTDRMGSSLCNEMAPGDLCIAPNYSSVPALIVPSQPVAWYSPGNAVAFTNNAVRPRCFVQCPATASGRSPDLGVRATPATGQPSHVNQEPAARDTRGADQGVAGVEAVAEAAAVALYPNPVPEGGSFDVAYDRSIGSHVSVVVSDTYGRIVYQHAPDAPNAGGHEVISTMGWSAGSYLVRINGSNGSHTRRVVVAGR
ncbi:MAG: T9SS type A sorting domain-containing protein [Bacteroidetes bacterium]|nr:T9SS type A sorting domain-containing protein [Bacteroidota bacterium]